MENYTVGNINNDFLSQSYSQSIERIAGTKDHIFNFQIPKKLLEVRKKAWVNLFGKYSEEMSDDIELNVDTLEPDEEEKEKEVSVKEYSCGQRIPMRKSATLIQYWINTGNPPYKAFLDENELSETGASLSEKEITLSLYSSIPNVINNEGNKQEFKNIELCSMSKEYIASKTYDQPTINIVTTGNTIQPNMYSQSCEKTDKMNVLSTSQRSLDIQSRDDIVRQFDQTSKRLTGDGENSSASNQDEVLEKDTFCKKGMSEDIIAQEIITKDTSLTALYRKKLYTGRNSPVDLILTKRHSINRLSEAKQSLHPALDSDYMIKRETLLVRKGKNKKLSLYGKKNLGSGKTKRKKKRKRSSISDKNITDTNNELPNNNRIQNYIINSSFNISSDYNNSDKRDDILLSEHNNANIFVKDEMHKQNLASLNLNPVVLLERITPSFKRHESKSAGNTQNHITRENSVHDYKYLNKSNKLYTCEIENVELETIDSDESTILICQCKANAQQCASKESDCSLNLRLSIEDDFFTSSTEEKDGELSSLKNTDISQNKESYSTTLEELPPRLSVNEDCTNVKSREIKVILEQLPSAMESQSLKKDDTVRQNNVSNKSKTFSSNSYGANKIGNVRFREIKVILERLPVSAMESQILNKDDIVRQNNVLNKSKTLSSSSYGANKTAYENVEASIQTVDKIDNYSLRMHTKSKEYNDPRISDTSDNVAEHQIFDKTESDSLFQYKNHSKVSQ
ncbi:putative serine threonine-protein kinase, partial [Lasius niger]